MFEGEVILISTQFEKIFNAADIKFHYDEITAQVSTRGIVNYWNMKSMKEIKAIYITLSAEDAHGFRLDRTLKDVINTNGKCTLEDLVDIIYKGDKKSIVFKSCYVEDISKSNEICLKFDYYFEDEKEY